MPRTTKIGLPPQNGTSLTHRLGKNYLAIPMDMYIMDKEATDENPGFTVFRKRSKKEMIQYLEGGCD